MTFQLECDADQLASVLNLCAHVAGAAKHAPILRAVRIAIENGKANISATDMDHAISGEIEVKGEGEAFIEIALIAPKVSALNGGLPVKIVGDGAIATISQGRTRWKVPMMNGEGWPAKFIETPNGGSEFSPSSFVTALETASRASGGSGAHVTEAGVLAGDTGMVIGASSSKMYVAHGGVAFESPVIIPRTSIPAIRSIFGKQGEGVIHADGTMFSIRVGRTIYKSKLVDGQFPPWRKVVEKFGASIDKTFNVDRNAFSEALGRAMLVREDKSKSIGSALGVRLVIGDGECAIRSANKGAEEGEDFCEAISDDTGEIGVNAYALREAVETFDCDRIDIAFKDAETPIRISKPGEADAFRFIMPFRVA
jgi:DNA polymerase-3 subunit beta